MLFLGLFIVFYLIISVLIPFLQTNSIQYSFLVFILVYVVFIMMFVFSNERLTFNYILAFVFVMLAFDIVMPPFLIDKETGIVNAPNESLVSSDVFFYMLLPSFLPNQIKYYIVYVFVPVLLLFIARYLISEHKFYELIKRGV